MKQQTSLYPKVPYTPKIQEAEFHGKLAGKFVFQKKKLSGSNAFLDMTSETKYREETIDRLGFIKMKLLLQLGDA